MGAAMGAAQTQTVKIITALCRQIHLGKLAIEQTSGAFFCVEIKGA